MILFKSKIMKTTILQSLLILGCLNVIASQRTYVNVLYCRSLLTLYDNGRADCYDCELDEIFYGHYWLQNDSLFVETFCSSECYEDHKCFSPRTDIYIVQSDSLLHIGYQQLYDNNPCSSTNICYFTSPHIYRQTEKR